MSGIVGGDSGDGGAGACREEAFRSPFKAKADLQRRPVLACSAP
jgi:hypothetical protein